MIKNKWMLLVPVVMIGVVAVVLMDEARADVAPAPEDATFARAMRYYHVQIRACRSNPNYCVCPDGGISGPLCPGEDKCMVTVSIDATKMPCGFTSSPNPLLRVRAPMDTGTDPLVCDDCLIAGEDYCTKLIDRTMYPDLEGCLVEVVRCPRDCEDCCRDHP